MTVLMSVKTQAYQIVLWQLVIVVSLAIVLTLWRGFPMGYAALLGGLAYWLPTALFVWRVFANKNRQQAKQFVMVFFAAEAGKLIVSAILFLLIVKYLSVTVLPVLIGFAGAIAAFWVASIIFLNRHQGVSR